MHPDLTVTTSCLGLLILLALSGALELPARLHLLERAFAQPLTSCLDVCSRPKAEHRHALDPSVMCAQVMSHFLRAACRISSATLKQNKELRMDSERYLSQPAENITPLVSSTYS